MLTLFIYFYFVFCIGVSRVYLFFIYFYLFTYFWLRWVFIAVRGLSLVVVSGGCSLLRSTGSRREGFSSCGMLAQ